MLREIYTAAAPTFPISSGQRAHATPPYTRKVTAIIPVFLVNLRAFREAASDVQKEWGDEEILKYF